MKNEPGNDYQLKKRFWKRPRIIISIILICFSLAFGFYIAKSSGKIDTTESAWIKGPHGLMSSEDCPLIKLDDNTGKAQIVTDEKVNSNSGTFPEIWTKPSYDGNCWRFFPKTGTIEYVYSLPSIADQLGIPDYKNVGSIFDPAYPRCSVIDPSTKESFGLWTIFVWDKAPRPGTLDSSSNTMALKGFDVNTDAKVVTIKAERHGSCPTATPLS